MTPNRQLKHAREARGWSHAKVAKEVGTDATTVSRWERGLFAPTPYFCEHLCTLFEKDAKALGLLEPAQLSQEKAEKLQKLTKKYNVANGEANLVVPARQEPPVPAAVPTQEQPASTRWEQAYVQALQKQSGGVTPLKEFGKSVFEHIKHSNAGIVDSLKLTPIPLSAFRLPAQNSATSTSSTHKKQNSYLKRPVLLGGIVVSLLLLLASSLFFFKPFFSSSLKGHVPPTPTLTTSHNAAQFPVQTMPPSVPLTPTIPVAPVSTTTIPAQLPTPVVSVPAIVPTVPAATLIPTAPPATATVPVFPPITVSVFPNVLTTQNCVAESIRYRCTVTLTVTSSPQKSVFWQASSTGGQAHFSPSGGFGSVNQPIQVITYLYNACQQGGQVTFVFRSSLSTGTASLNWQC